MNYVNDGFKKYVVNMVDEVVFGEFFVLFSLFFYFSLCLYVLMYVYFFYRWL